MMISPLSQEPTTSDDTFEAGQRTAILPSSQAHQSRPPTTLTSAVLHSQGIPRLLGELLEAAGLTNKQVAERLGLQPETIYMYTNGRRANPTIKTFMKFAEACGARVWVEFPRKRG